MPDTRPGIEFDKSGVCLPCRNYEKQKTTDWGARLREFEKLCSKYRGQYGESYNCAIAVSGGKDSHYQVYYMKEVMRMNPVLLAVGNIDWTETGRKNLANLSDTFSCDIISLIPNHNVTRKLALAAFKQIGQPTWYADALIYSYPYRMTAQLGIKLLVYGENINYTYGGKQKEETHSAKEQPKNGVLPPWRGWEHEVTEQEMYSATLKTDYDIEPVYLSYFTRWDSHRNYEVAKRYGFKHLGHEYIREGTIEQYNQLDSISYLLNQFLKYPKFGHASATEMASRWIRAGLKTRKEMIPIVEEFDGKLDQGIVENFCAFTGLTTKRFYDILDLWYNPKLFTKDRDGIWHPKFKVGNGI